MQCNMQAIKYIKIIECLIDKTSYIDHDGQIANNFISV